MITCARCSHANPLGTLYCHKCGSKLDITYNDVIGSVSKTVKASHRAKVFGWGKSALTLCGFLLAAAIALDVLLVPKLPPAQYPTVRSASIETLFGTETPRWVDAGAGAARAIAVPPLETTPQAALSGVEARRPQVAAFVRDAGLDAKQLATALDTVLKAQKPDGSWLGNDPQIATAFAALALQALPGDANGPADQAAAKGRAWLAKQANSWGASSDALALCLGVAALHDGGQCDAALLNRVKPFMADGRQPGWQTIALLGLPAAERPNPIKLRAAAQSVSTNHLVMCYQQGIGSLGNDAAVWSVDAVKDASLSEAMAWLVMHWQRPQKVDDLLATLARFAKGEGAQPAIEPGVASACGPWQASAAKLLLLGAPLRVRLGVLDTAAK